MSGSRDDGTFAKNKAHHPARQVGRFASFFGPKKSEWEYLTTPEPTTNTPNDWASPTGIPRPILGKHKWSK